MQQPKHNIVVALAVERSTLCDRLYTPERGLSIERSTRDRSEFGKTPNRGADCAETSLE
jgi:hypothetical protein